MECLTFGTEFEFVVDIRQALPSNHKYLEDITSNKIATPSKSLKYAGKAIKEYLERTAALTHAVALSAKIAGREKPLNEEEKGFSAWIIKGDVSIRSDAGSPASGSAQSSDEEGAFQMSDDSGGPDDRDLTV